MDAGENNTRLGTLLRHERRLGNKGWLGDEELLILFKDPTVHHLPRETRTAVKLCSTRNQKSLRNAFYNSSNQKGSVRCFESSKGHKFTWDDTVGEFYKRDLAHEDPVTTLNAHSVYSNSWNKM